MSLKIRLIPVLLYKDGFIVKSQKFNFYQTVGNPFEQVQRYNKWNLDELIYLNISNNKIIFSTDNNKITGSTSSGKKYIPKKIDVINFVKKLSSKCFMPLTYGGGINNINTARQILKNGADKISINSYAFKNKKFISECARYFGSQSIIVSIDCKKINKDYYVYINDGKTNTNVKVCDWAAEAERMGAGEILLNSIDKDGAMSGFDIRLCQMVRKVLKIPLIVCGGAANSDDFEYVIKKSNPHSVAAANIFQFKENSYQVIKKELKKRKLNFR